MYRLNQLSTAGRDALFPKYLVPGAIAYVPRSRVYRRIWQGHRLHHFKNEHYWHGITNTISDRALGTYRDQRDVPRSRTARSLPGA